MQPYLRLADLSIHADEDTAALSLLANNAPELEDLKLSFTFSSMRSPVVIASLSQTICSLYNLREILFTVAISADAVRHLSTLPRLTRLSIFLDESNCTPLDTNGTTVGLFPALKNLLVWDRCKHRDTSHMIDWLRGIRPPSLRFLSIQAVASASSESLGDLLSVIATYSTLQEVDLFVAYPENTTTVPDPVPEEAFRPLLIKLRDIHTFKCTDVPLDWSGSFVQDVASAWPNLVSLALEDCWRGPSRIQLYDLAAFARLCPALEKLSLAVSPDVTESFPVTNETSSELQSLSLGNVVIDFATVPRVAAFLDAFFPAAMLDMPVQMYYAPSHSDMLHMSIRAVNNARRRRGGGDSRNTSFGTSFIGVWLPIPFTRLLVLTTPTIGM